MFEHCQGTDQEERRVNERRYAEESAEPQYLEYCVETFSSVYGLQRTWHETLGNAENEYQAKLDCRERNLHPTVRILRVIRQA